MTVPLFVTQVGGLALLWIACWGVSFWFIRRGVTYIDNPTITSVLFLSFSVPVVVLHWPRLEPLTRQVTAAPLLAFALALALTLAVYALIPRILRRPEALIARHPEEFYLRMDHRYLVPKSFEVLFQQLVIVVLTTLLADTGLSLSGVVLAFLGIFGVLHLPMLLIIGTGPGLYYGVASVTLAAAFPLLILRLQSGFLYSYAAHWFFYTVVAVFAWASWNRRTEAAEPAGP